MLTTSKNLQAKPKIKPNLKPNVGPQSKSEGVVNSKLDACVSPFQKMGGLRFPLEHSHNNLVQDTRKVFLWSIHKDHIYILDSNNLYYRNLSQVKGPFFSPTSEGVSPFQNMGELRFPLEHPHNNLVQDTRKVFL